MNVSIRAALDVGSGAVRKPNLPFLKYDRCSWETTSTVDCERAGDQYKTWTRFFPRIVSSGIAIGTSTIAIKAPSALTASVS